MANTNTEKERFYVLDIFRGIFASFVFLFHLSPFANTVIINNNFFKNCDLFVDFFFILSGFVIALNYVNLDSILGVTKFIKKRFLRIYPLHFCMLIVFLMIEISKNYLSNYIHVNNLNNIYNTPSTFFSSLLLLNSTPILNGNAVSWNIPSWSISAEMIAYLVFALMILLPIVFRLKLLKVYSPYLILVVALSCLIYSTNSLRIDFTYDFGFIRGVVGFFVGIISYKIYKSIGVVKNTENNSIFTFMEVLSILLVFISIYFGNILKNIGLIYELVFLLCILVFCFEKGSVSNFLKNQKFLSNLGKYSYSFYMTHAFMISIFNILFIRILHFSESSYSYLFILNFWLIYLLSSWTYNHIEMRFYTSRRKS